MLVLWLNSTLGLLNLITFRVETEGPWVHFKKKMLAELPVLDIRTLGSEQIDFLARTFDSLSEREFRPLPLLVEDETRVSIDHALSEVLNLPDLSPLREMLVREPVVSMQRL